MCITAAMLISTNSVFTPVNNRIATIRHSSKFYNISLICTHAPTKEKADEVKDKCYAELENVYNKCPTRDVEIVPRDFNAKFRREGTFGTTVRQVSFHANTTCDEMRRIDFASVRNMVVCSINLQHVDIHKAT